MAKTTTKKAKAPATKKAKAPATPARKRVAKSPTAQQKPAVATAADLSDEVLKAVETGQRAAIEAVRKFVDTVDEALPAIGDRPSRRETVIDGALEMADKLVSTQYDFLRSVVQSAGSSLGEQGAAKK